MVQAGFEPAILGLDTSRIRGEKDTRLNHSATGSADTAVHISLVFWACLLFSKMGNMLIVGYYHYTAYVSSANYAKRKKRGEKEGERG